MKKVLLWLGIVVVVLIVAGVAAYMFVDADTFRPQIEEQLSESLGRKVTLGKLHLSLMDGALSAEDITIADDPKFSNGNFLEAKSFSTGVEMKPLIFDKILHVTSVKLDKPDVTLIRNSAGVWNFSTLGGSSGSSSNASAAQANAKSGGKSAESSSSSSSGGSHIEEFRVDKLDISDGTLTLAKQGGGAQQVWTNVALTAKNIAPGNEIPITLSGTTPGKGSINIAGTAGPLETNAAAIGAAVMHLKFTAKNVPAEDVQGLMAVLGGTLPTGSTMQGGVINTDLQLSGPFNKLVTTGPVSVSNVRLTGSIVQKLSTIGKLAGTTQGNVADIKTMSTQLRMAPEGIRADSINIVMPALGTLTGAGTIDNANRMNFNMLAKLNASAAQGNAQLNQFGGQAAQISQAVGSAASQNGVQFTITGSTDNPVITVNTQAAAQSILGALAQQQLKGQGKQGGQAGGFLNRLLGKKP